jgi:C-terminal processing protease CtpA/Prc
VRLKVRSPAGKVETRSVATIDRSARLAARIKAPKRDGADPQWTMEQRGPTALLTMDNWALYDSRWNWRGWLDDQMTRIATNGTRGLVIDIRANEGGQDCGDVILARLLRQPLPAEAMQRLVRFREVPADLRKPLDTWDKSFVSLGKDAPPAPGGYYRLASADTGGSSVIAPSGPRFDGKVALLTSSTNSSATFQFAKRMKDAGLATLVGEPTGGNRRGINGGAYFFVRLPDSGLEFDLPLIGYFPGRSQPDAGIRPDVPIPITAAAIAGGRDEALEKGLQIVA